MATREEILEAKRIYNREYYQRNKERIKENQRQYWIRKAEQRKAEQKEKEDAE